MALAGRIINEHLYTPTYSVLIFVLDDMPTQEDLVMGMSTAEGELQEKHF